LEKKKCTIPDSSKKFAWPRNMSQGGLTEQKGRAKGQTEGKNKSQMRDLEWEEQRKNKTSTRLYPIPLGVPGGGVFFSRIRTNVKIRTETEGGRGGRRGCRKDRGINYSPLGKRTTGIWRHEVIDIFRGEEPSYMVVVNDKRGKAKKKRPKGKEREKDQRLWGAGKTESERGSRTAFKSKRKRVKKEGQRKEKRGKTTESYSFWPETRDGG